jgi:hypothetical protein
MAQKKMVVNGITHVVLRVSQLFVKEGDQRDLSPQHVNKIVKHFDWQYVNEPLVVKGDKKGMYQVADGMHTLTAIIKKHGRDGVVLCRLITDKAHAALIKQNSIRRGMTKNALFWVNLHNEERETYIAKVCDALGIILQNKGRVRVGATRAVGKLCDLYDAAGGKQGFRRVICLIVDCYSRPDEECVEAAALTSEFLDGLCKLILTCEHPFADIEYALSRSTLSAADVSQRAFRAAKSSSTRAQHIAKQLRAIVARVAK